MNVFELFGKIALTGGDKVRQELTGIEGQLQKASTALKVTGAAFTAVGAAGLKFASDARNVNATLGSTAITLGVTTKELRNLLLATTNATFPVKSVAATFDILTRAGVRNTDELQKSANAFDALADATGSSAEVVAEQLIPVFRAFGQELPRTSKEMDKFTWLTKNTTVDLGEFTTTVSRLAPEMQQAGISMDDAVISLAALNAKGIVGRKAIMELGEAVKRASENNTNLATELGLTSEELVRYESELSNSTGLTDKHGEALNKQVGFMEKVKQKFSELTLVAGSFLEPLEPILAAMTALGPVMIFLSTAAGVATIKWIGHTAALVAHRIAALASAAANTVLNSSLGPVGIALIAIGAVLAIAVPLMQKLTGGTKDLTGAMSGLERQTLLLNIQQATTAAKWNDVVKAGYLTEQEFNQLAKAMGITGDALYGLLLKQQMLEKVYGQGENRLYYLRGLKEIKLGTDEVASVSKEATDKMIDNLKTLSAEAKRRANETTQAQIKAIDKTLQAEERAYNEKISLLDKEKAARLSALDDTTNSQVSALQTQIDAIDKQTDTEELALTRAGEVDRLANLKSLIDSARTAQDKAEAQKNYDEFVTEVERNELLRRRDAEKDSLRESIEAIRATTESNKEILEAEYQEKKARLEQEHIDLVAKLELDKTRLDEALELQLKRYDQDVAAFDESLRLKFISLEKFIEKYNDALSQLNSISPSISTPVTQKVGVGTIPAEGYGFANGGLITEPTWLTRIGESLPYGVMAEKRPEFIVPQGSASVVVTGNTFNVRQSSDIDLIAEKIVSRIRLQQGVKI